MSSEEADSISFPRYGENCISVSSFLLSPPDPLHRAPTVLFRNEVNGEGINTRPPDGTPERLPRPNCGEIKTLGSAAQDTV